MTRQVKLPNLSNKFVDKFENQAFHITMYAERLARHYAEGQFHAFLQLTLSLPCALAEWFDFANVLAVFDNLDMAHVRLHDMVVMHNNATTLLHYIMHAFEYQQVLIAGKDAQGIRTCLHGMFYL